MGLNNINILNDFNNVLNANQINPQRYIKIQTDNLGNRSFLLTRRGDRSSIKNINQVIEKTIHDSTLNVHSLTIIKTSLENLKNRITQTKITNKNNLIYRFCFWILGGNQTIEKSEKLILKCQKIIEEKQREFSINIPINQNVINHIKERHWHDASTGNRTSHFLPSTTAEKLHHLAMKTINEGSMINSPQGQGRKIHQYTFEKPIGIQTNGTPSYTLKVITQPNIGVITAFPV